MKRVTPMITPQEAVKFAGERTIDDMYIAVKIANEFRDTQPTRWNNMKILAAVWNAGRVQGIREERRKRHI